MTESTSIKIKNCKEQNGDTEVSEQQIRKDRKRMSGEGEKKH
jgi:hypothetical protein